MVGNTKKAQGLPLNTIVISILVIIVLVVIVAFFVSKSGETIGKTDEVTQDFASCTSDNPLLSGKTDIQELDLDDISSTESKSDACKRQWNNNELSHIPGTNCCVA